MTSRSIQNTPRTVSTWQCRLISSEIHMSARHVLERRLTTKQMNVLSEWKNQAHVSDHTILYTCASVAVRIDFWLSTNCIIWPSISVALAVHTRRATSAHMSAHAWLWHFLESAMITEFPDMHLLLLSVSSSITGLVEGYWFTLYKTLGSSNCQRD